MQQWGFRFAEYYNNNSSISPIRLIIHPSLNFNAAIFGWPYFPPASALEKSGMCCDKVLGN